MLTEIGPAAAPDREAAVRRLLPPPRADRLLALLASGEVAADHLLVARRGGRLVGAAFAEVTADGLAEVDPPAGDDVATADALAVAQLERLRAAGVAVAQCLLAPDEVANAAPLLRAGFRHVTRLVGLRREPAAFDFSPVILHIIPVVAGDPELVATFAATLTGSSDMPELTGVRPPAVELAGYPATHRFLARVGGEPVGLLLLAAGEVQYLGLVPGVRGKGCGTSLLRLALAVLAADGATVTVSTDGRNRPAIRLYERHGFRRCRSQEVFLWTAGN